MLKIAADSGSHVSDPTLPQLDADIVGICG
jgi:hypothetical protein